MTDSGYKPNLEFADDEAAEFIGKHLLVGITHRDLEDSVVSYEQFHGIIDRINRREGIVVKLTNSDDERKLPPDLSRLEPASPGQYRLKSTGEIVENPDYTVMWTIYPKGYQGS